MFSLPPPQHPDEHLMHSRTQRKLEEADNRPGKRAVSTGDVVLLSGLALALAAVVVFLVIAFF